MVLIDIKENKHENTSNRATSEVISSIIDNSVLLDMCKEVITNRQKPNKLAAVFKMCCEVLFATLKIYVELK